MSGPAADTFDLEKALKDCRVAARRGLEIAKGNLQEMSLAVDRASSHLSDCFEFLSAAKVSSPEVVKRLKSQMAELVKDLRGQRHLMSQDLAERGRRLDRFSISLFGRTMVGKSTLMEILTRGDGKSIGLGAQRTTRDVRVYHWQGLEVTDVPGVAAFEGQADEAIAFKAAAQADLILFLLSDDAPQPVEAECLAQVCRLGKPVLGICNVKAALSDEAELRLFFRNPDRLFNEKRIEGLLNQFYLFVDRHIPGLRQPFKVTHLLARYLADQPEYEKYRDNLLKASRFEVIEQSIINEVAGNGKFMRIKSFIDSSVYPMMNITDSLFEFSSQNVTSFKVLNNKRFQLIAEKKKFEKFGNSHLEKVIVKTMESLREEGWDFAEVHYDDPQAGQKWTELVASQDLSQKMEILQKQLFQRCQATLNEVTRELAAELKFVSVLASKSYISTESVFNFKRAWNWGAVIATIGAFALSSNPVGWVVGALAVVSGLVSLFLDDKSVKVDRAKKSLREQISDYIDKIEINIKKKLKKWLKDELLIGQFDELLKDFEAIEQSVANLAEAQRFLAWTLNNRQKILGRSLVKEALGQLGAVGVIERIIDVARIPGVAVILLVKPDFQVSPEILPGLAKLLGERVSLVIDTKKPLSVMAQVIGCDPGDLSLEDNGRVARVAVRDLNSATKARLKLAQQLTGAQILR
ncbi:MAG: 50S ribosome-binding GTPase [Deltaproteobacteria bacterium]|jgi:hypothetical protein|nr:50S ribosome-binding GTPase [Deltaproteobacteria bacterium]